MDLGAKPPSRDNILIIGFGDIGERIAHRVPPADTELHLLTRRREMSLLQKGLNRFPHFGDLDETGIVAPGAGALPSRGALVFYLAPPPTDGITDPRMANFIAYCREQGQPRRLVYISTSGVYGDCGGARVDETTPTRPLTDRAKRRLDAERQLQAWAAATGVDIVILRVGGIYGPGRLPIERIRAGVTVICPEEAPSSNRIHAEDLAEVCLAAARRGRAGEIYNVSDGQDSTMTEYFYAVADAAHLPRPPCVPYAQARAHLSPAMWSFVGESRRLHIEKLRRELAVRLRYPSLVEGIAASL